MDQLERYILDQPWTVIAGLALLAVIVFYVASKRAAKKMFSVGVVLALLAAAVFAASWLIVTPRQIVMKKTRTLVQATAPLDAQKIEDMLDPHATFSAPGQIISRDGVRAALELLVRLAQVKSHDITGLSADPRVGNEISVHLGVSTTTGGLGGEGPVPTQWLIVWRQQADGSWKVYRVQWERLAGQPVPNGILPGL